jgi:hypothetical protein
MNDAFDAALPWDLMLGLTEGILRVTLDHGVAWKCGP